MNEENKMKSLWILMREPRLTSEQMASVYKAVATSRNLFEAQLNYRHFRHEQNCGTTENEFKVLRKIWEKTIGGTANV
jgi:hypothetical protein